MIPDWCLDQIGLYSELYVHNKKHFWSWDTLWDCKDKVYHISDCSGYKKICSLTFNGFCFASVACPASYCDPRGLAVTNSFGSGSPHVRTSLRTSREPPDKDLLDMLAVLYVSTHTPNFWAVLPPGTQPIIIKTLTNTAQNVNCTWTFRVRFVTFWCRIKDDFSVRCFSAAFWLWSTKRSDTWEGQSITRQSKQPFS